MIWCAATESVEVVQTAEPEVTVPVQIVPLTESVKMTLPVGRGIPVPLGPVRVAVKARVVP